MGRRPKYCKICKQLTECNYACYLKLKIGKGNMASREKSLITNTSILSFGTLCTKGIMFFMTPLFTRWLTANEYGDFDLISSYISLFLPIITLSSGEALFRFLLSEDNKSRDRCTASTVASIYFLGITLTCIFIVIYSIVCRKENFDVIICAGIYLISEIIYNYALTLMRGLKKVNLYAIGSILFVISMVVSVTVFVKIFKLGIKGILIGYTCGNIFSAFIMIESSKAYQYIDLRRADIHKFKEILQYSIPMIPNAISWWIISVSDRTIVTMYIGSSYNAIYAVANKLPSLCTTFFDVFHLSWQQSAIETMADEDHEEYYNLVFNSLLQVVGSICIAILGINYWFFYLLFPEEYSGGIFQAPILIIAFLLSMLSRFIGGIYVAQMKAKENGITSAIAAVVNVLINLALISKIGLFAASISTLVAYLVLFLIRYIGLRKEIRLQFNISSLKIAFFLIIFFLTSYFTNFKFQIVNCIFSLLCFCMLNYKLVRMIFNKIQKIHRSIS